MQEPTDTRPLSGITVVDFTRMLAGPFCTALLADQGAEVIKIEAPQGDDQRHIGAMRAGESLNFQFLNRNKRSLRLDMRSPEGKALARRLALQADVVIENFRPGVAARLGIGADGLRAENPGLICCAISGFGQDGPMAASPSYDVVAQALSGMMSVTGAANGPPTLVGDSIGDIVSGIYAAQAICAALSRRARDGTGATIDVAMFDALFSLLPTVLAGWLRDGTRPQRHGNEHPLSAPFGAYMAADEPVMIAVANATLFERLATAIDRSDMVVDPRYATDPLRHANRDALRTDLEGWTRARTAEEVVSVLTSAGIPVSRIWGVDQAAESPQAAHRGLLAPRVHPRLGTISYPEQPVHFAGVARGQVAPAPDLGADGAAVLTEKLGFTETEIADLASRGIL